MHSTPATPAEVDGADPVLLHDWHPLAAAAALPAGASRAAKLLGHELVVWRTADGAVHAAADRCPHRGTRLSIGRVDGATLACAYHGWRYAGGGQCVHIPAHLRKVVCGPYAVEASGPRIVENFLDMAHFPFVHAGILGEEPRNEVRDYAVERFDDGEGGAGIRATGCFFWQPQTNSLAHGGCEVEYTYRVVRPLTAILTKVPGAGGAFHEAISLHVQPVAEESSIVWIVLALTNFEQDEETLRAFQDRIFLQDKPILENQVPKRLPLERRAEIPVRADRLSLAYRDYLRQSGLRHGVIAARVP